MEYKDFFEKVNGFLKQAEKHKRRGNNDFNPYLQMLSESDEVNLHSSLIYGFLDPKNNHYQGDVFLETFLECVGLKEWFGDTSNAEVHKERKRIDIYITNGNRHIIIENKIWADDKPQQIQRYIDKIVKEQSLESSLEPSDRDSNDDMESSELESSESETTQANKAYKNISVLYLAPYKRMPLEYSLGEWEIQGDYLVNGGNQVRFKAITYKKEILAWIEKSQTKVGCITNLNAALLFYKDVVQIITNKKENTMSIAGFLTNNKDNNMQENMEIVFEILENQNEIMESYCKAFAEKHREQIESKGFEIFINKKWRLGMIYELVIRPKERNKIYMAFCVRKSRGKLIHGIELFCPYNEKKHNDNAKHEEYNTKIINKMKEQGMDLNWFNLDWNNKVSCDFSKFAEELQRFLDDTEQEKWNEQIEKALQNGLSELIQGADKD